MQIDLNTLKALGLSKEDIAERIINRVVETLLTDAWFNEDGEPQVMASKAADIWNKTIRERLDAKILEIGEKHILPLVDHKINDLVLKQTNRWGEKTGTSLTITEYMVARAEAYMLEDVDYQGKTKAQDSYQWRKNGTRIEYAIDKYLQYHIDTAMKAVIMEGNKALVGGLTQACKIKLEEIAASLKVEVRKS